MPISEDVPLHIPYMSQLNVLIKEQVLVARVDQGIC